MIGDEIRRIRESKRIGLNELARISGLNASYISSIERNKKTNPSADILTSIADALDVSIYKFTREDLRSILEDRLQELSMTFNELSEKTKLQMSFFQNLDEIIPTTWDYDQMKSIAKELQMSQGILQSALSKQEIPLSEYPNEPMTSVEEDFKVLSDEELKVFEDKPQSITDKFYKEIGTIIERDGTPLTESRMKRILKILEVAYEVTDNGIKK